MSPALLHQVGLDAVNTYREAAVRGIDLFVRDMSGPFNWVAYWGSVGGNVIWAAACFSTGGTAFAISLAGIGVGSAAALSSPDEEGFSVAAEDRTNALVTEMRNQVASKGDDVAREGAAASPTWNENRSRSELLRRIGFKPEHIVIASGGLTDVDAAGITARTRAALLLEANRWRMGVIGMTGGDAIYKYDLANYRISHYWGLSHEAAPPSQWGVTPHSAQVLMPEGSSALASIRRGMPGPMKISEWPVAKTIVVPSDTTRGLSLEYCLVRLDSRNQIEHTEVEGIFKDYVKERGLLPNDYGRQVVAKVWAASAGLPPNIP
jgi:hypothetical protein